MAIDYSGKTIAELNTILANCKRLNKTNATVCIEAEAELKRRPTLQHAKSRAMILSVAREDRYISYGQLAEASGVPWSLARRAMDRHLGELVTHGHNRGWPMLTAIVVNKPNVSTGRMDAGTLKGFIKAAHDLGRRDIDADLEEFLKKEQARLFAFAKSHSDLS